VRGPWTTTRCPAPVHAEGGWLRCVVRRDACDYPNHQRWPVLPMAVLWWLRPWWPNKLGRAQEGLAHTPNVSPCRHCERSKA
jgi:hypothetical protein